MAEQKKSYQMTLEEYQRVVVPHIAEYFKFLKKYAKYFVQADYYGLQYLTWSEYLQNAKEQYERSDSKTKYNLPFNLDYTVSNWVYKTNHAPPEQAPEEIISKKNELYQIIAQFITDLDVKKFEKDERKSNKRAIKRAADSGQIVQDLMDGKLLPTDIELIFGSVGLKVPRHVQEMRDKVEKQGYSRSTHNILLKANKDFEDKLRVAMQPHKHVLEDRYKNKINYQVGDYLKHVNATGDSSVYKYTKKMLDQSVSSVLYQYTKEGKKVENYEEMLDKSAKNYAESFLLEFVMRVQEKLKVINEKKGVPTFEIKHVAFNSGKIEGQFTVDYSDQTHLFLEVEVILAGGHNIQSLHNRYLFKVFKDGKFVKLEDIDKAFESLSEGVKLNRFKDHGIKS